MDAGGGPGRSAFEFVKRFNHVESYDYSHGFIESLNKHKSEFLNEDQANRLIGYQGDAHEQDKIAKKPTYNMILGCNLIDRLIRPTDWVKQSVEQMTPNDSVLIISSPYTWKREHADPEVWIGGKYQNGQACRT